MYGHRPTFPNLKITGSDIRSHITRSVSLVIVWFFSSLSESTFFAVHFSLLSILEMFQWLAKLLNLVFFRAHLLKPWSRFLPIVLIIWQLMPHCFVLCFVFAVLLCGRIRWSIHHVNTLLLNHSSVTFSVCNMCILYYKVITQTNTAVFLFSRWMCSNLDI